MFCGCILLKEGAAQMKKKFFGFLAAAASIFAAVALICRFGFSPIFGAIDGIMSFSNSVEALCSSDLPETDKTSQKLQETEDRQKSDDNLNESEPQKNAVPVSNNENALGAVIRKSVGGGNIKYQKIALNNKSFKDINIKNSLARKIGLELQNSAEPQVLIYHTHTTEGYMSEAKDFYTQNDSARNTDNTKNVFAVGEALADSLKKSEIVSLHDGTQHDNPSYSGSYKRSAETIKNNLSAHPSVKLGIDLHRDSIPSGENDKVALTKEIGGKQAAQIMIIVSTGYDGSDDNFTFALRLQQAFEAMYPGLARPMTVYKSVYNQDLLPYGLLIEVGTDANSLDEAKYSGELIGNVLGPLLKGYCK